MTSSSEIQSCYVFLDIGPSPIIVASYRLDQGKYKLTYGQSYLSREDKFALDPLNLAFQYPNTEVVSDQADGFGVIADATPDNWGKKLTLARHTRHPRNQIEWFLAAKGASVGALVGSLSRNTPKTITTDQITTMEELESFLRLSVEVSQNGDVTRLAELMERDALAKLIDYGSSMGGARPKTIVQDQGIEWIAKFNRSDDVFNNVQVEYASMQIAKACGINTSHVELREFGRNHQSLFVKRFDRNCPERKKHYISARSLMNIRKIRETDFALNYSYMGISKLCTKISNQATENQTELFKRMVLNAMIANTDDHTKNHGFLLNRESMSYNLSPVFDVLPHIGSSSKVHAIGLGDDGRVASMQNILSQCHSFGLSADAAKEIIKDITAVVENWTSYMRDAGVKPHEIKLLEQNIDTKL